MLYGNNVWNDNCSVYVYEKGINDQKSYVFYFIVL